MTDKIKYLGILNSQEVWQKLVMILRPEKSFYYTAIIYSIGVSVLTLGIPISVQALVNTVTFGVILQPLLILSIVLLGLLVFSGGLNALQTYIIEIFQRHFYARTTTEITRNILNGDFIDLENANSTKLANRYFDIMTVQKSVSTLLAGGIDIVLQTFVGLILLAFYHPYFLAFNMILIFFVWLAWFFFWKQAVQTSVLESQAKYETVSWIEEIARENMLFKSRDRKMFAFQKSDNKIMSYLKYRTQHFKYYFYQSVTLLSIYAILSAFVLGLGGYLVIIGELTLGQLVAAELVVTVILSNFAKSSKYLESFYDLYAGIDKISAFYNIEPEKHNDKQVLFNSDFSQFDLNFENVLLANAQTGHSLTLNYNFEGGQNYFIYTQYHGSRVLLVDLFQKVIEPKKGGVTFGVHQYSDINPSNLRDLIYVVSDPSLFEGTIKENLTIGHDDITPAQINAALDVVDLSHLYTTFEEGLETVINYSGYPLWSSQVIRLEIARAILLEPKVIIFTESFDQIQPNRRKRILKFLTDKNITVIMFSHRNNDDLEMDHYLLLTHDEIVGCGDKHTMQELIEKNYE